MTLQYRIRTVTFHALLYKFTVAVSNVQFFKVETTKERYLYREGTDQIFLSRGSLIGTVVSFIGQHLALKLDIWKKLKWIRTVIYSIPCAKQKGSMDKSFSVETEPPHNYPCFLIRHILFFSTVKPFRNNFCVFILPK